MRRRLLIVDDEPSIRSAVTRCLVQDYDVFEANDAVSGLTALLDVVPDVLICDVVMPGGGGQSLVAEAFTYLPDLAAIVTTGRGEVGDFVEFFRLGVADFLRKPFTKEELRHCILRALETRRVRRENARLRQERPVAEKSTTLVGDSEAMARVRERIQQVAPTDATVLITGASGTGKEVVARRLHHDSPRRDGPFVAVHCGALHEGLLESELFGHVRGAFTGADWPRAGRFEEASGGTLFLDEVGTMTPTVQTRLLRVLQERRLTRLGDSIEREVDLRIVAATNADLERMVAEGSFREDLFYRLDVFPIELAQLKDRQGDVLLLANHFLRAHSLRMGRAAKRFRPDAARLLAGHSWPGNVRELENVVERAVILAEGRDVIAPEDLLLGSGAGRDQGFWQLSADGIDLPSLLEEVETDLIDQALERSGGSKVGAASLLCLPRTTLSKKLARRQETWGAER